MGTRLQQRPSKAVGPVRTRSVEPQDEELSGGSMFPPVPQIEGRIPYEVSYEMITPEKADDLIRRADADPDFHQRPCALRDVDRWRVLMATSRFVNYLPNGPVCFDDKGMLLNGKTRLTGLAGQNKPHGFVIFRKVPRWMFPYFDTGRTRSVNDVFVIAGKAPKSQTGSTTRLAMRYREFLQGDRSPLGWQNWAVQVRDEHIDVTSFLDTYPNLMDWYSAADQIYRATKINISALMVWRWSQTMAWTGREAERQMASYWEGLLTGAMLPKHSPALELRQWAMQTFQERERIRGKRELHLLLLNRMFGQFVKGESIQRISWAHGLPMNAPFHPSGAATAIKNVLKH